MKLLNISIFIVSLASFAGAKSLPKAGDLGNTPAKTVVKAHTGSRLSDNSKDEGSLRRRRNRMARQIRDERRYH
jgi:hypothetical protein